MGTETFVLRFWKVDRWGVVPPSCWSLQSSILFAPAACAVRADSRLKQAISRKGMGIDRY